MNGKVESYESGGDRRAPWPSLYRLTITAVLSLHDFFHETRIYKITFLNKGKVYEVFAKQVYQSDLYGFVEVEDYMFDAKTQMVVDPSEEKLKAEFNGVKRSFIPIQAIIRIDEVEKSGVSKISNGDYISPFPVSLVGAKADTKDT